MKRLLAGLLCGALLAGAHADDAAPSAAPAADPPPLQVLPKRQGYAFDQPEILVRQRLFGLAHGLSLLAAACLDLPDQSAAIQEAYAAWHERQAQAIETLVLDLARYYFGPRATEAQWPDLARALNLNDSIQPSLGQIGLQEACASLPTAIARPRYEFDKLLAEAAAAPGASPPAKAPE